MYWLCVKSPARTFSDNESLLRVHDRLGFGNFRRWSDSVPNNLISREPGCFCVIFELLWSEARSLSQRFTSSLWRPDCEIGIFSNNRRKSHRTGKVVATKYVPNLLLYDWKKIESCGTIRPEAVRVLLILIFEPLWLANYAKISDVP